MTSMAAMMTAAILGVERECTEEASEEEEEISEEDMSEAEEKERTLGSRGALEMPLLAVALLLEELE